MFEFICFYFNTDKLNINYSWLNILSQYLKYIMISKTDEDKNKLTDIILNLFIKFV